MPAPFDSRVVPWSKVVPVREQCLPYIYATGREGLAVLQKALMDEDRQLFLPDRADALTAIDSWYSAPSQDSEPIELEPEAWRRLRARTTIEPQFQKWPYEISNTFSLYVQNIPTIVKNRIINTLKRGGVLNLTSSTAILARLNDLGAIAKKYRDLVFGHDWMYFVDLHTLTDYKPRLKDSDFIDDVKEKISPY